MAAKTFTRCYSYVAPDKPFNEKDLLGFVAGNAGLGALLGFALLASGAYFWGFVVVSIQIAATIQAVADEWLYHRLVCIPGAEGLRCAVGTVVYEPEVGELGEYDNDEYFDLRLMPHRPPPDAKDYPNAQDHPKAIEDYVKRVVEDNFQGYLLKGFEPGSAHDRDLGYRPAAEGAQRAALHCEAEGAFWQIMKDYAVIIGAATGAAATGGAAIGCAIGFALFGPIGCMVGALLGALLGAAWAAQLSAAVAYHADPGDVSDAQVGDTESGPIVAGDRVVVVGRHVYDGFHEGWNEIHPLCIVQRIPQYVEQGAPATHVVNLGLVPDQIDAGMADKRFRRRAREIRDRWCDALEGASNAQVQAAQKAPENRWTIHPDVDGCEPPPPAPPPIH